MKKSILFLLGCMLCACTGITVNQVPDEAVTIRLMTHDSFNLSENLLNEFQNKNNITVEIFSAGDGGEVLNKAILAKEAPLADVLYGVDNTFLSRALENDIFLPYESPELINIADHLKLDASNRALPVDYGDVCLNYDKTWFGENALTPPQSLEDLADPAYKGLTAVLNPATSTPGLAFLLTTISAYGEDGYLDYWSALVENDVLVSNGWSDAYYGQFTAASDGDRPIVVSYASSPPAEVFFADPPVDEAPTAAVTGDKTCFRQIEFVGVLKGTDEEAAGKKLVDFLLSQAVQEDLPLQMFVYPAHTQAQLPEVFQKYSIGPENPVDIPYEDIAAKRQTWIKAWTETVLPR